MRAIDRTRRFAVLPLLATMALTSVTSAQADQPTDAPSAAPAPSPEADAPAPSPETAAAAPSPEAAPAPRADAAASSTDAAPSARASSASRSPVASYFLAPRIAGTDIAAFPSRLAPDEVTRPRGIEVHGFVSAWATPVTGNAPSAATEAFRLRFAVLRIDARPFENVTVLTRIAPTIPGTPLLDAEVTYTPHPAIGITAGQFRAPLGASATTLAPQLVMLDRPGYVYAMSMIAFRDVGVMLHSGPNGIANGLFHYRLAILNGEGRAGVGVSRAPGTPEQALYVARAMFEPSRLLFDDARSRLVFGATFAHVQSPAIATGDPSRDRSLAANVLGRNLTPYWFGRDTEIAGGDATFEYRGIHVQAETLYLHSTATNGGSHRRALGSSLEVAYTLPYRIRDAVDLQLAARGERFDPRIGKKNDQQNIVQLGVNAIAGGVRGSVFGTFTFFETPTGANRAAGELTFRAAAAF